MTATTSPVMMVTGAGGHLGHRVVELLLEAGATGVIASARNESRLGDLRSRGVATRRLDFSNPDHYGPALTGVDRMLLISTDLINGCGIRLTQQKAVIDAAVSAGVKHIVYTSIVRPGPGSLFPFAYDHDGTERHLLARGVSHTILRNNQYVEMLVPVLGPAIGMGVLMTSAAHGACAYVTREDCARVAAAALNSASELTSILDVTGPEAITYRQLAQLASDLTGRHVELGPMTLAERRGALAAHGVPPVIINLIVGSEQSAAAGHIDSVSSTVETLTRRKPQSVREFFAANPQVLRPDSRH